MKKVSIIVPVYNVEKYLRRCLDSLVSQTLEDIEIIVVNDGSPDNCQIIIDEYSKKFSNKIRAFIKENGGQGSARNFGIDKSNSEFIAFVDSDDFIESNMYEILYNEAKKKNLDIVVSDNYVYYEKNGKKISNCFYDKSIPFFSEPAVWNKIIKSNIIKDNKIYFRENKWYEDLDFSFKLNTLTKTIGYVNIPLYNYVVRDGSTMNNKNIERNKEIFDSINEIIAFNTTNSCKLNDEIEFLAIRNIFICTSVRIIKISSFKDINSNLINYINYMKKKFPKYKQNKYLYKLSYNEKIIYNLLNAKLYWIVKLLFLVKK